MLRNVYQQGAQKSFSRFVKEGAGIPGHLMHLLENPTARAAIMGAVPGALGGWMSAPSGEGMSGALKGGLMGAGLGAGAHVMAPGAYERASSGLGNLLGVQAPQMPPR